MPAAAASPFLHAVALVLDGALLADQALALVKLLEEARAPIFQSRRACFQGSPVFSTRSDGAIDGLGGFSWLIYLKDQPLGCPMGVFFWHHLFQHGSAVPSDPLSTPV
jgi:hypothetical protein